MPRNAGFHFLIGNHPHQELLHELINALHKGLKILATPPARDFRCDTKRLSTVQLPEPS
jgi:hypothetical protein